MKTVFVAIGANTWGVGETIAAAQRRLRAIAGGTIDHVVLRLPEGAEQVSVDPLGRLQWEIPGTEGGRALADNAARWDVKLKVVAKRGNFVTANVGEEI